MQSGCKLVDCLRAFDLKKSTYHDKVKSAKAKKLNELDVKNKIVELFGLNPHLVKAPKECIDYVILHELCHISEHNHSDKFWRLLTQVMPNWKEVKAKLDDMAELYLNE